MQLTSVHAWFQMVEKKLDMPMNIYIYIACSNSQQRLMPPFTSDLQMPLSWVQIDECTSYEFESSKPPLC